MQLLPTTYETDADYPRLIARKCRVMAIVSILPPGCGNRRIHLRIHVQIFLVLSSCNPLLLVGALVLFAEYALSLDCFAYVRRAVENFAAFVAKQNFQAMAISTPANVLIDCFYRAAPQWFYAYRPTLAAAG
ncbi:TPA: hypothetical protein ACKP2I_000057 [Serratia marcescens]